jgi:hypothetical protein
MRRARRARAGAGLERARPTGSARPGPSWPASYGRRPPRMWARCSPRPAPWATGAARWAALGDLRTPAAERDEVAPDVSAMSLLLEIDERSLVVRVEAGGRGADVEAALKDGRLRLRHDPRSLTSRRWVARLRPGRPGSRPRATAGSRSAPLAGVRAALRDGMLMTTPNRPRARVGPDAGAEGTFGVICEATLGVLRRRLGGSTRAGRCPTTIREREAVRACRQGGLVPAIVRRDQPEAKRSRPCGWPARE